MPAYRTKQVLRIAKLIRDAKISTKDKVTITKLFNEMFLEDNPIYNEKQFIAICNSTMDDKTLWNYNRMLSCGDLNDI